MKGFFKRIIVAAAAVLSLTSCATLLPKRINRSSKSDDSSLISDTANQSSDIDNSEEDDYYIQCSDENAVGFKGYDTYIQFSICRYSDGAFLDLTKSDCRIDINTPGIELTNSGYYNSYTYYAQIIGYESGRYSYTATLKAAENISLSKTLSFYVNENTKDDQLYVEYDCFREFERASVHTIRFLVYEQPSGIKRGFNPSHPFDVDMGSSGLVVTSGGRIEDEDTSLYIEVRADTLGEGDFYVKLILDTGETINTRIFYKVKPFYQFVCDQEFAPLAYGEKTTLVYRFMEHTSRGPQVASMKANTFRYECDKIALNVKIVDIDRYSVTLELTNKTGFYTSYISLYAVSTDGYQVDTTWELFSEEYFKSDRNIEFSNITLFNGRSASITFRIVDGLGEQYLINKISIVSTNGFLPNVDVADLNQFYYTYEFTPSSSGYEILTIDMTDYEGQAYHVEYQTNIQ